MGWLKKYEKAQNNDLNQLQRGGNVPDERINMRMSKDNIPVIQERVIDVPVKMASMEELTAAKEDMYGPSTGITPDLLLRQAYKESTFNPKAVSPAGYKGLTQIGDQIIQDFNKAVDKNRKIDPFNPQDAIDVQKYSMNELYNASFNQKPQDDKVRIAKTLAAYNWGRGNLVNFLNRQKKKGIDIYDSMDWMSDLPKETREYIQKILLDEDETFRNDFNKAIKNPNNKQFVELYKKRNGGWLKKYEDGGNIPKAQDGITVDSPEYRKHYNEGDLVLQTGEEDYLTSLPTVELSSRDKQYPYYHTLSDAEKEYFDDKGPIGRAIRGKATSGRTFNTDDALAIPGQLLSGVGEVLQAPQSAMVEGIEALRGKEYDFERILPSLIDSNKQQRTPSDAWGYENPEGFVQHANNFLMDAILDPLNIAGGGAMSRISTSTGIANKLARKPISKASTAMAENIAQRTNTKVDDFVPQQQRSPLQLGMGQQPQQAAPWKLEELPGLHLQSTMSTNPKGLHTQVSKDGKIHVENALKFIGKESGGKEKVEIIRQALGDNLPQKMDYNEFRRKVNESLIPLEHSFTNHASKYGLDRLGYNTPIRGGFNNRYVIKEAEAPLENQTLILSNKNKFGKGSNAHNNPGETLGHIHFLRDSDSPDVLTVSQIQSDAFQKSSYKSDLKRELLEWENYLTPEFREKNIKEFGKEATDLLQERAREVIKMEKDRYKEFLGPNPTQKQLLDKNHQERYLQELIDYASKRGDVNKMRLPTSETAAKVQNYSKLDPETDPEKIAKIKRQIEQGKKKALEASPEDRIKWERGVKSLTLDLTGGFELQHQTILNKYRDNPKLIKKLFGEEPKLVKDSKGNEWYEFDIPKNFKEGKGEIKAFKDGGWLKKYQGGGGVKKNEGINWDERRKQSPSFTGAFVEDDYTKHQREQARASVDSESVEFLNSYFNSPEFDRRFKDMNAEKFHKEKYNGELEILEYLPIHKENTRRAYEEYQPHVLKEDPNFIGSRVSNNVFNPIFGAPYNTNIVLSEPQSKRYGIPLEDEILPHEYSHTARDLTDREEFYISLYSNQDYSNYRKEYDDYAKKEGYFSGQEIFPYDSKISLSMFMKDSNIPKMGKKENLHDLAPNEIYSDLNALRYNLFKEKIFDIREGDMTDEQYEKMLKNPKIKNSYMFKRLKKHYPNKREFLRIMNEIAQTNQQDDNTRVAKQGAVIEDNRGQWAHPGKVTKINSGDITMKGVPYPVLGVSDAGEVKMMEPEKDYKFKGNSVTEYPILKNGKNLAKKGQLTNFTNRNAQKGWLSKYQ